MTIFSRKHFLSSAPAVFGGASAGQRPDRVVRFGRGPILPPSLRRPVPSVLV